MVVICDPPRGTLASAHGHDLGHPMHPRRGTSQPHALRFALGCCFPALGACASPPRRFVPALRRRMRPAHSLKGVTAPQRWLADPDSCGILALLIRVTQAALFSPCHPHVGGGHAARALPAASRPRNRLPPLCRSRRSASCPVCQLRTVMVVCLHPPFACSPRPAAVPCVTRLRVAFAGERQRREIVMNRTKPPVLRWRGGGST